MFRHYPVSGRGRVRGAQSTTDGVRPTRDGDSAHSSGQPGMVTQHIPGHSYFCHSGVGINYCAHDYLAHLHMRFQEQESVSRRAHLEGDRGGGGGGGEGGGGGGRGYNIPPYTNFHCFFFSS